MAKRELPSPELLRKLLSYNPATGVLTWVERPLKEFSCARSWKTWNTRFAGSPAGTKVDPTQIVVRVKGTKHQAHRIIWAMMYGHWPNGDIDHINHDPHDNRLVNLRDVPHAENQRNMSRFTTNTSGVTGVHLDRRRGRWVAFITRDGKNVRLGGFKEKTEAIAVRKAAEMELGYHSNHGA